MSKRTVPYEVCTLCDGRDRLVVLQAEDRDHAESRFESEYRRFDPPKETIRKIKKV